MNEEHNWFKRTFENGSKRGSLTAADGAPPSPDPRVRPAAANVHTLEEARLAARAEALTEAARIARVFEEKGGNAGIVRLRLSHLEDEAWARVEAHRQSPLAEAGHTVVPASASGPDLAAAAESLDHVRGKLIRLVDAGHAPTLELTTTIVEVLELVSAMLRGSQLVRQDSPRPGPRAAGPPTLRAV